MSRRWVFALLLAAGCGGEPLPFEPAGPDAAPDPSTWGPYPVGVRTIEVTDPRRFDPETRIPRRLTVEIWYPAAEAARGRPGARYPFADFLTEELRAEGEALGALETQSVRDAEVREGAFPLVLFSHGSGGIRVQSTFLTERLASHGYVVASPDHAGNTLADLLRDGGLDLGTLTENLLDRPRDLIAVLDDALARFDIDAERIGAAGHSFGAMTALRAAALDPRIRAVVAQAPANHLTTWLELPRPLEELGIPVMIQDGRRDATVPVETNARTFLPHLRKPAFYLSLLRAGHFTFSDLCALDLSVIAAADEVGVGDALEDGCDAESVPPEIALPLLRHFSIGLFNAYLRRSPGTRTQLLDPDALRGEAAWELLEP